METNDIEEIVATKKGSMFHRSQLLLFCIILKKILAIVLISGKLMYCKSTVPCCSVEINRRNCSVAETNPRKFIEIQIFQIQDGGANVDDRKNK